MTLPLLDIEHIEICYGKRAVVQDVSLTVKQGEILGIVGESGSGKSTVIKAVMGLLDGGGTVTKGAVYYRGKNVAELKNEDIRKMRGPAIGMIFQSTESALSPLRRIEDQLYESVRQHEKVSRRNIRERALELFNKMGILEGERILKSYPFELSGGLNQRVGIMMAMILKPRLLLADEPTSALDVTVQSQVIREMVKMRELYGMGMVIVTHHMGVVERMADKVAVMHQGRLVEYGKKEDVIGHPREAYTKKLMDAVLRVRKG